jgi:hypothetical protein
MTKLKPLLALAAILLCLAVSWWIALRHRPGRQDFTYDGHITTWLLLAPIPLEPGQSGTDAIGKEQIKDEANLRPKAGDKFEAGQVWVESKAGDKFKAVQVWREYRARDYYIDFNDFLGHPTEYCAGYAVCYIHADRDMNDVMLMIGSDDQARVYLNGTEVIRSDVVRQLNRNQNGAKVILKKGVNVLVFKVINEFGGWQGCARFTDRDGNPITNLKVSLTGKEK